MAADKVAAQDSEVPSFDFEELFGENVVVKEGGRPEMRPLSVLKGKYVAIYFSAHWCPPCRQFTPLLAKTYAQLQAAGKPFEVVFVSSDRNVEAFSEYYSTMPWAAVPFGEYTARRRLATTFKVNGIPSLIILGPDGSLVNANARGSLAADPKGAAFPWKGSTALETGGVLDIRKIAGFLLIIYIMYRFFF